MKSNIIFLVALSILVGCHSSIKPNDLKEYGFHGKVKRLSLIRYCNDLQKVNGQWDLDEEKIELKEVRYYNKKGNANKISYSFPLDPKNWNEFDIEVKFKNGYKDRCLTQTEYGDVYRINKFSWQDNYHYVLVTQEPDGSKHVATSVLNKNFRDLSGTYQYIVNGSITVSESYINNYDATGGLINSCETDELKNEIFCNVVDFLNKDKYGNGTLVISRNEKTGDLHRVETRIFEYYE